MAIQNIPNSCPSCGNPLVIESLRCPACNTGVEGHYALSRFMRLHLEQLQFCETFLRCRGNLKDVGTLLGISYPTARNRLDELLAALDFGDRNPEAERMDILDRLSRGEIRHEEAIQLLKGGKPE